MTYSKQYNIRRRIISHNDIIALCHFFETMVQDHGGICSFEACFSDGSCLDGCQATIFEESFFKNKDATSIKMKYSSPYYKNFVQLLVSEDVVINDMSCFQIHSDNEDWLNATYVKLKELVDVIPRRSIFRYALCFPWMIGICILIPISAWKMMPLFGYSYGYRPLLSDGTPDPNCHFISGKVFFLVTVIFSLCLVLGLSVLFPEQEFAFGISRHPRRLKLRKALGWILATIIIPMALTILL